VDKVNYGSAHQLQLWIVNGAGGWQWKLRNAYVPGGVNARACELDSGSDPDYQLARSAGQAAFDRVKAEELAKVKPADATTAGAEVLATA